MPCSSTYLYLDFQIWFNEEIFSMLLASYQNLTQGDKYDCALSTVPCESNITKALITFDPDTVFWSDLVLVYILLTSMFSLGTFGNVCNIIILSTNNIANGSTNNLLLATSVSDLILTLSIGVSLIHSYTCFFDTATALTMYNLTTLNNLMLAKCFELLSLDFITVMAIQRAVAVVFPFKISEVFSNKNTNIIIALLVVVFLGTAIPITASTTPQWIFHPYFGKRISLGYKMHISFEDILGFYYNIVYLFRSALNLLLLITSASTTVYKLQKHVENRSNLKAGKTSEDANTNKSKSAMSDREVKVVRMCSAVSFISFVVYFIQCAYSFLNMLYRKRLIRPLNNTMLLFFTKTAGGLACSFNFLLYLTMSSQFRECFLNMFRGRNILK